MTVPTRHCRKCDVAWASTPACWLCGAEGGDKFTNVGLGPNLAGDWDVPFDEDGAMWMWAGY